MTTIIRPRVCIYGNHLCTTETGAYAVAHPSIVNTAAAACGPCFAREHGADAPHGHTTQQQGRACPVCGEWLEGNGQ